MRDKAKDAEDRLLEVMFRSVPMADDGFSRRVVARIRWRIWLRRLLLPTAVLVGGCIAARPVLEVATATSKVLSVVSQAFAMMPIAWIPPLQVVVLGAVLLIAMMLSLVES